MQDSGAPTKIALPWGAGASSPYINSVPVPSQQGTTPGRASWTDGFPPLNAVLRASGGVPPFIGDMNGGLNQVSAGLQWLQAGPFLPYDATFQSAIGGYRNGSVVASVSTSGLYWLSTVDNNNTNPDSGGAGWEAIVLAGAALIGLQVFTASGTFTVPTAVTAVEYEIWGAGGGAGGTLGAGSASSSGAGGGYCCGLATGLTPGGTVAVTVGVGGTGGDGTPHNGTAGGSSSFGAFGSATGGGGGFGANGAIQTSAPSGGAGSGGTLTYPGLGGGFGFVVGSALSAAIGGAAFKSPAPSPQVNTIPTSGSAGTYPGVGGNGSTNGASGGNGANGLIIVRWAL